MKQRRLLRFHSLKRGRVRQTWNKYNLFNIWRLREPHLTLKTLFQQKWGAKSATRSYHGEHIKEYQWNTMFNRRVLSAVNMDPKYMAQYDGSEQATGRGSGRLSRPDKKDGPRNQGNRSGPTPYGQMVFAPMERRLDIAIFRALFASSARQARQFVLHGAVTVNGKKMTYPGYLLNPGDMFQVKMERVLLATGAAKRGKKGEGAAAEPKEEASEPAESAEPAEPAEGEEGEKADGDAAAPAAKATDTAAAKKDQEALLKRLRDLAHRWRTLNGLDNSKWGSEAAKRRALADQLKQIRELIRPLISSQDAVPKPEDPSVSEADKVDLEMSQLMSYLKLSAPQQIAKTTELSKAGAEKKIFSQWAKYQESRRIERELAKSKEEAAKDPATAATTDATVTPTPTTAAPTPTPPTPSPTAKPPISSSYLPFYDQAVIFRAMRQERQNPKDSSKPYATPWRARDYMAPFAFIPRYLEVNQRICAAVYLRHPVARPGLAEVPTPFPPVVSQLAHNWYLKRR
ncbi:hypothetical protein B0J18DRAFT_45255 [Chaetomium sp. MPI-SDFR-AT-0129]|nr:hypothetical protein B0J18DRAFT_45255 [Chaetomium sp. MPI-SDFR-AT-0129]